jgi:hypothetical protein
LRDAYLSLSKALPQISYYAATDKLKVFMSHSPGQRFAQTEEVNGAKVTVSGERDGQAIVIHPTGHEFLAVGYRSSVSLKDPAFQWPEMRNVQVMKVYWAGDHWNKDGEPGYSVDQSNMTLYVELDTPQVVLVTW